MFCFRGDCFDSHVIFFFSCCIRKSIPCWSAEEPFFSLRRPCRMAARCLSFYIYLFIAFSLYSGHCLVEFVICFREDGHTFNTVSTSHCARPPNFSRRLSERVVFAWPQLFRLNGCARFFSSEVCSFFSLERFSQRTGTIAEAGVRTASWPFVRL